MYTSAPVLDNYSCYYAEIYNQYFAEKYSRSEFDKALENRRKNIKEFTEIKLMEYLAITHHNDPSYASNK